MLRRISKLFLLRRKRRNQGQAISSIRSRQFERLECRSMLSASMGTGPGTLSEYTLDKYEYGAPPHGNEDVYAPISQLASMDGFIPRGDEVHYAHLDSFNQFHPAYNNNIGDGPGAWALGSPPRTPLPNVSMSASASSYRPAVTSLIVSPTFIIFYVDFYQPYSESYSTTPTQPSIARATAPPVFTGSPPQSTKTSVDHTPNASKGSSDLFLSNTMTVAATAAAIPSAAQITARYTDKTSLVPNAAVDAAMQSYAPHLLFVANDVAVNRAMPATASENTIPSDNSFDDFIELSSPASVQMAGTTFDDTSVNAYDAVNTLLDHLREFEIAPGWTNGFEAQVAKDAIHDSASDDTPLALALADFALANAEGGMVMLDRNDAQSSEVDFSNIADNGIASPASHLNFESAVGFYQAIEVAGEEAPAAIRATTSVPVRNVQQSRTESRLSTENARATNGKAAVVAGATALIGAAVWCAQRKQSDDDETFKVTTKLSQ